MKVEVEARLRELVAKHCRIDARKLSLDQRFERDLGADSLDLVELLMEVEKSFGIHITAEEAERVLTLREAICLVEKNLGICQEHDD